MKLGFLLFLNVKQNSLFVLIRRGPPLNQSLLWALDGLGPALSLELGIKQRNGTGIVEGLGMLKRERTQG